ncbi:hypothetical protein R3P38DRAFT_2758749 [Favolaschia claudopus]|uniref:EF-hand domain-containing protein n=1 Tax=Favolaschia claudopus TaxID=2862362 RepID=A0AAW0E579_9AGAR
MPVVWRCLGLQELKVVPSTIRVVHLPKLQYCEVVQILAKTHDIPRTNVHKAFAAGASLSSPRTALLHRKTTHCFGARALRTLSRAHSSACVGPVLAALLAEVQKLTTQGPTNPFIVRSSAPEQRPKLDSPFAMLMQLDASGNAVLTEAEFRKLFVRCLDCKLYTTPAAFEDHRCRLPSASAEIIDS